MKLTLFFTEGVSLFTWHQVGLLARELALYRRLIADGMQVEFVTYGNRGDYRFENQLEGIKLLANDLNLPIAWYQKKLELLPPSGDVFKSNQIAGADVGLAAARRAKAKFVARCGYLLSDFQQRRHGRDSQLSKDAYLLEKEVFTNADRIVVTTPEMKDFVNREYDVTETRIAVIPNYVETQRFRPEDRQRNNRIKIVFVGRLDPQKNLPALLEATRTLDVELHLVGYGPMQPELTSIASGSIADIRFHNSVSNSELPKFLASCDMFVLPSLYEGHPKALLEAMSVGLAVIGTRVSGIAELLRDGEDGLLCEPDPASIRAALVRLIEDEALRTRLGVAARKRIERDFSLDHIVDLEKNMLRDVLAD